MISNDEILNIKFKICDGLRYEVSEDGIYKAVKNLLDNTQLYNSIKENLNNEVVDSTQEIKKLEQVLL